MRSRVRSLLAGGVVAMILAGLAACAVSDESEPASLVIRVPSFATNLNPLKESGDSLVVVGPAQFTYDPLLRWDRSSTTFEPWLAEEFDLAADQLLLSVKLREDVDFVDGTHMDAAAVVAYYEAALASEETRFYGNLISYGLTFEVTGDYTFEIASERPLRFDFFYLIALLAVGSPELTEGLPDDGTSMGSGPYLVDEIVPDVSVTFVRNPDYWNPEAYDFDSITLQVFADDVAALNAMKSGTIDASPLALPLGIEAEAEGFVFNEGIGTFGDLFIQDTSGEIVPALGDVRVRQAMNLAFDRELIAETLDLGRGEVSSQAFIPQQPEYVEGGDDRFGYDPDGARELLADAGFPDGFDLTIYSTDPSLEPVIEQYLGDIGIRVTFAHTTDFVSAAASHEYPVIALRHIYTNTLRFVAPDGLFAIDDPVVGPMIDRIQYGDPEDSVAASRELGEFLLDEAWHVPFSKPPTVWATIPGVEVEVGDYLGIPALANFRISEQ